MVAEKTGRSLVDIYGVATFYRSFSLKPRGKHLCSVCLGTACHVRGGPVIAEEFERAARRQSRRDHPGPRVHARDGELPGGLRAGADRGRGRPLLLQCEPGEVKQILEQARAGLDKVEVKTDQRIFPVEVSCPRCNHSLMDPTIRRRLPVHPGDAVVRARARLAQAVVPVRQLHRGSEHEIPLDTVVNFFCPHCHAELIGASRCPECGAPMVPMIVRGGGVVQICSRRGCKGHIWTWAASTSERPSARAGHLRTTDGTGRSWKDCSRSMTSRRCRTAWSPTGTRASPSSSSRPAPAARPAAPTT